MQTYLIDPDDDHKLILRSIKKDKEMKKLDGNKLMIFPKGIYNVDEFVELVKQTGFWNGD